MPSSKANSELGGVEWLEQELKRNGLVNDTENAVLSADALIAELNK